MPTPKVQYHPTLPPFGEIVPGEGGRLGAIMRGDLVEGVRQPDYAIIVSGLPCIAGDDVKMAWGSYGKQIAGAASLTDGQANTAAMLKAKLPIARRVTAVTADGHSDFYLPARNELRALYLTVPELFAKQGYYWSSTQNDAHYAFCQDFEDGYSTWCTKFSQLRVRACRRIQLHHFSA
jgi:hypothetical protein